jgi:glycerol-3-phosphate acyltransferase PlsY
MQVETWLAVLSIFLGYLLGSIPSAYILVRLTRKADIRTLGTGNMGALNTYQQLGPAAGIAILIADVSKGMVAVFLPLWIGAPDWARYGSAIAAVVGHTWPVFLSFRGGKGAATILGVALALAPPLAAIAVVPLVVATLTIRNVVIGVAAGFILFNVLTIVTGEPWSLIAVCLGLTFFVVGNYLVRTLRHTLTAIRQRRWHSVVY